MAIIKENVIFIHVPKNAGISIGHSFLCDSKYIGDHTRVNDEHVNDTFNKFMVCRNPFDRLISSYEYQKKMADLNILKEFKQRIFLREKRNQDFSKFVDFVYTNLLLDELHTRPQKYWTLSKRNIPLKNLKVIRFENLQNDLDQYFTQIKMSPIKIKEENASIRSSFFNYYSNPKVISQVQELYKQDFKYFNYSTDIKNATYDKK